MSSIRMARGLMVGAAVVGVALADVAALDFEGAAEAPPQWAGDVALRREEPPRDEGEYARAFAEFKRRFNKTYDSHEEPSRFSAFRGNYDLVQGHNAKGTSYELGLNEFADLTGDEFLSLYGMGATPRVSASTRNGFPIIGVHEPGANVALPPRVDWREKGAVTGVKSQGQCGACWAFATTGSLEGAWHIATGQLPSLSEQQLVDCSTGKPYGNLGCKGGNLEFAMLYAKNTAICNEATYPYQASQGQCHASKCRRGLPMYAVRGYMIVSQGDEQALMHAVSQQPVEAQIDASSGYFQLYKGGILDSKKCGTSIDHAVLIVGYGTDNGKDYWLIKNSWGTRWGENGYVRLVRGVPGAGECAVALEPVYPVVDGSRAQPPDVMASVIAGAVLLGGFLLSVFACKGRRIFARCCPRNQQRAPLLASTSAAPRAAAPPAAAAAASTRPSAPPPSALLGGTRLGGGDKGSRLLQSEPAPEPQP